MNLYHRRTIPQPPSAAQLVKNYPACHCDVAAVGGSAALQMRALRLPVGAKRRGNLVQEVSYSPESIELSKQFCEIATTPCGVSQ